jgi:hypothetical protein
MTAFIGAGMAIGVCIYSHKTVSGRRGFAGFGTGVAAITGTGMAVRFDSHSSLIRSRKGHLGADQSSQGSQGNKKGTCHLKKTSQKKI